MKRGVRIGAVLIGICVDGGTDRRSAARDSMGLGRPNRAGAGLSNTPPLEAGVAALGGVVLTTLAYFARRVDAYML